MRFLRRAWWAGIAASLLLAIGGGYAVYSRIEPAFKDLRQQRVLMKTDLEDLRTSTAADLRQLSGRLVHVEQSRSATLDDLEKLKTALEQEIQAVRSGTK
jgi:prefoldin subunit 5